MASARLRFLCLHLSIWVLPGLGLLLRQENIRYSLWLDTPGYAVQSKLTQSNQGLIGEGLLPDISTLRQSSQNPDRLLALDKEGKVYQSQDFGKTWSRSEGRFNSARLDLKGQPVLTQSRDLTVGDRMVGPKPSDMKALLLECCHKMGYYGDEEELLQQLDSELVFVDGGVDLEGRLWILVSSIGKIPIYGGPFGLPWREHRGLNESALVLLLREKGAWSVHFGSTLRELSFTHPASLDYDQREMDLLYKGQVLDTAFYFTGLIERAGWLKPEKRYYAFGEEGVQLGYVTPSWLSPPAEAHSWGYVVDQESHRYGQLKVAFTVTRVEGDSLQFLIPSDHGFWRGEVPLSHSLSWRRVAHFLAYGWGFWVVWLLTASLAYWISRRARS